MCLEFGPESPSGQRPTLDVESHPVDLSGERVPQPSRGVALHGCRCWNLRERVAVGLGDIERRTRP
jgi:hypothetical protein